jgi:hypothetical protein
MRFALKVDGVEQVREPWNLRSKHALSCCNLSKSSSDTVL